MQKNIIIYMTDLRQRYIAEGLIGEKMNCLAPWKIDYSRVGDIIFPTPFSKLDLTTEEADRLRELIKSNHIKIYGGLIPPFFRDGIDYVDLMEDEEVVMPNAKITAEAVLSLAIEKSVNSIEASRVLITGFGRCARECAWRFKALGAGVKILARKEADREKARHLGYEAGKFEVDECYGTDILINTVPAMVIDEKIIRILSRECLLIDIASKPGGCDFDAAKRYQINYIHALGLPGRYSARSGAEIMLTSIRKHGLMEGDAWIYQITP